MTTHNSSKDALGASYARRMKQVELDRQIQADELARHEREAATKSPAERASELSAIADELLRLRAEGSELEQPEEAWARVCERKASDLVVRAIAFGAFASPADATLRSDVLRAHTTYPPVGSSYSYSLAKHPFIVVASELLNRLQTRPEPATYFDGLQCIADAIEASARTVAAESNTAEATNRPAFPIQNATLAKLAGIASGTCSKAINRAFDNAGKARPKWSKGKPKMLTEQQCRTIAVFIDKPELKSVFRSFGFQTE